MANNILNPLEKELLIKLYRRSLDVKIAAFCDANNTIPGPWTKMGIRRGKSFYTRGICDHRVTLQRVRHQGDV